MELTVPQMLGLVSSVLVLLNFGLGEILGPFVFRYILSQFGGHDTRPVIRDFLSGEGNRNVVLDYMGIGSRLSETIILSGVLVAGAIVLQAKGNLILGSIVIVVVVVNLCTHFLRLTVLKDTMWKIEVGARILNRKWPPRSDKVFAIKSDFPHRVFTVVPGVIMASLSG